MKASEIAKTRLSNSGLAGPRFASAHEVVRAHGGMQSQDYEPAKWSIGQRLAEAKHEDIETAIADGRIIRTHVLRPTWHFVVAEDLRWMLEMTGPRVQRAMQSRYRELGLDAKTLARVRKLLAAELAGGRQLTRKEVNELLTRSRIDTQGQRLPHMLGHCELEGLICSGARKGKQQTFALIDERVPLTKAHRPSDPATELVLRYLSGHGPATVKDLRWWSSLTIAEIREALEQLGSQVTSEKIEGFELWSVPDQPRTKRHKNVVHLLQTYDEIVVGYTESRYLGDPHEVRTRAAWKDRDLPTGIVLMNERVIGLWRRTTKPRSITAEVLLYEHPDRTTERALEEAVERLGSFHDLVAKLTTARIRSTKKAAEGDDGGS